MIFILLLKVYQTCHHVATESLLDNNVAISLLTSYRYIVYVYMTIINIMYQLNKVTIRLVLEGVI